MLIELSCLAVDTVITSACYYGYKKCLHFRGIVQLMVLSTLALLACSVHSIHGVDSIGLRQDAAACETQLNPRLRTLLKQSPDALPYVCISGQVSTIGKDKGLLSQYQEGVVGVLQKLVTKEHKTQRIQGYWTDFYKVVRDTLNIIPFCISSGNVVVEVSEPLESRFIRENLTVTHDVYKPKTGSMLVDRIFGDVSKGFRDTEKMLKIGTTVLGFGRLVLLDSGALRLEKPNDPSAYIITSLSKPELFKALEDDVRFFKILTGIFGFAGLLIGYVCLRKFLRKLFNDVNINGNNNEDTRFAAPIREARRRRNGGGNEERPEHQCVVCLIKPRELVLLECGHICLCADCAEEVFNRRQPDQNNCPICRGRVSRIMPIFMA